MLLEDDQMNMRWSRREFMQWVGYSSLTSAGLCSSLLPTEDKRSAGGFAYVASNEGAAEGIHAYSMQGRRWEKLQTAKSTKPVALALAPNKRFLYAVNQVDSHKGLPVGTIEAFAIEHDGRLTPLNRRELALSATMPRHAAVSPDGLHLVVAVRGGGAYNVLPIAKDGTLGRVSGILKEIGRASTGTSRGAQPQMVAFDKMGRVVSVDGGADRVNVLSISEGVITAHQRAELRMGAGPSQVAMHPAGESFFVVQADAITYHRYDAGAGSAVEPMQRLPLAGAVEGPGAMAVHSSGRFMYACLGGGGVAGWRIDDHKHGSFQPLGVQLAEMGELHAMEIAPNGRHILGINRGRGVIQKAELDLDSGSLRMATVVARVDSPSSLAVLYS
jgi:6-phosphogluconolactonase (cycloisomerase 2 family)